VTSTVWHALFWRGVNLTINADNLHIRGHYLLAVMSNIHLYAGGLAKISPHALMNDRTFDLWLFEGKRLGDTIGLAYNLFFGRHVDSKKVRCISFHNLTLESDTPLFVQVDAEPISYQEKSIEIKVISNGLKLLVPKETPRELFKSE
jgi:diacylglycerol kinase family enzyme